MGILKENAIVESTANVDPLKNLELDGNSTSKNAKNRQKREAGEVPIEKSNDGRRKSRVKKTDAEKSAAFLANHGRPWIPKKEWIQQKIDAEKEMGGSVEADMESDQVKNTKRKVKKGKTNKRDVVKTSPVQ